MYNSSRVHMHLNKNSLRVEIHWSNFQTYSYSLNHEAFTITWILSDWKIEQSSVHYFLNPLFNHCSRVFNKLEIKIRDSLHDTLKSLIYEVFLDLT
jgi:hypothetical protein